jgi:hypothetical protein
MPGWRRRQIEQRGISKRDGSGPKLMVGRRTEAPQVDAERTGPPRGRSARERLRHDPDESILGERACRPPTVAVVSKPIVRGFVVDVGTVEERDEDVDVKQRRGPQ